MDRSKTASSKPNELELTPYWRYTGDAIDATPDKPGVFAFFCEADKLILLGSATKSLRAIFRSHWMGYEGKETCGAAYIAWEEHPKPMTREAELVKYYVKKFGRVPRRQTG